MSVALENAIMKILGSTKTRLTPEDIVAALKKLPEYQRHQNSALKVNVVKILDKFCILSYSLLVLSTWLIKSINKSLSDLDKI